MGRDLRQEALTYLLDKADKQGYVTFDDIMDCADANSLPIQDFDWLASAITTIGILVYAEAPASSNRITQDSDDDDYNDYAQSDYESVYDRIIELDESLSSFVNEVRNIKPPQWRELSQLKYQVLEGNLYARNRMIEMHLRLALKIALQRAETYDMDIQDAVGEACVGLVTAVDKYNPNTNGAFGSYATMWILQNIARRQPTQRALVHYPVHKKDSYFAAYPVLKEAGWNNSDDIIDYKEALLLLMKKFSYTEEQAEEILKAATPLESFETLYYDEEVGSYSEEKFFDKLISDEDVEDNVILSFRTERICEVLDTLKDREKEVLQLRYGLLDGKEKTLEEIGQVFGVTRERVRQIEMIALRKLRHPSRAKKLRDYS